MLKNLGIHDIYPCPEAGKTLNILWKNKTARRLAGDTLVDLLENRFAYILDGREHSVNIATADMPHMRRCVEHHLAKMQLQH